MADLMERFQRVSLRHDIPQTFWSEALGIDEPRLSRLVRGKMKLTAEGARRLEEALDTVEKLAKTAQPFVLCFHDFAKVQPVWSSANPRRNARRVKLFTGRCAA